MIGIICAGGEGTRLRPLTGGVSKHLLPIYDKPMIYYPISLCLLAGIREIVIIVNEQDKINYARLFTSSEFDEVKIHLAIQEKPNGIVGAIQVGLEYVDTQDIMVVLGDNVMFGSNLTKKLSLISTNVSEQNISVVFSIPSASPEKFGVVKYNQKNDVIKIVEKPKEYISNDVVPGVYFFKNGHLNYLDSIKSSKRGELEISDYNALLLKKNLLRVEFLGRGVIWLDCGDTDSLLDASNAVQLVQKHSGQMIGDISEILSKSEIS